MTIIKLLNGSNNNPKEILKISSKIQSNKIILVVPWHKKTSKKINRDNKKVKIKLKVLINALPNRPKKNPKPPAIINPNKGKNKTKIYIKKRCSIKLYSNTESNKNELHKILKRLTILN